MVQTYHGDMFLEFVSHMTKTEKRPNTEPQGVRDSPRTADLGCTISMSRRLTGKGDCLTDLSVGNHATPTIDDILLPESNPLVVDKMRRLQVGGDDGPHSGSCSGSSDESRSWY